LEREFGHDGHVGEAGPETLSWNRPSGGMFLWTRLPEGLNAVDLLPQAVAHNVAFVPGAAFYANQPDPRSMRLSFVTATVEQINTGIAALAATVREAQARLPR
jgi:2-aminoadipate transaminase